MKHEIVKLLRWILNYLDPVFMPVLSIQERRIHNVRWIGVMGEYDAEYNIKQLVATSIANELIKNDMIKIDVEKEPEPEVAYGPWKDNSYKINAVVYCVKPL